MKAEPTCPRCGGALRAPGLWSSAWQCDVHGPVPPLQPVVRPTAECVDNLRAHAARASTPLWVPWPLPTSWVVTGLAHAGDERTGAVATIVGCSGPAPLGGPADLLLVAETPGVGLAARLAGLRGPDPGDGFDDGPAHAKVDAAGHPTPMWNVDAGPDLAVYVGEAKAAWIWALLWPAAAGVLLLENLGLRDLVERSDGIDVPFGALMPRLAALGGRGGH
ncbi:MAG TPA: DUF6758 family protein [Acidothermaceae bacterium]|jgi:hypothetical protein|nr:DUF6758 family protein [Acidothermaceae bacterium]